MFRSVFLFNANGQFLRFIDWQDAVRLMYRGGDDDPRAQVVKSTDIELGNGDYVPHALRLQKQVRRYYGSSIKWTPDNLKIRDGNICQYCEKRFSSDRLTVDHVTPVSRGGQDCWTNTVAACKPCNNRKDNCTPNEARMPLINNGKQLRQPTVHEFFRMKVALMGIDEALFELGGWY